MHIALCYVDERLGKLKKMMLRDQKSISDNDIRIATWMPVVKLEDRFSAKELRVRPEMASM